MILSLPSEFELLNPFHLDFFFGRQMMFMLKFRLVAFPALDVLHNIFSVPDLYPARETIDLFFSAFHGQPPFLL